MGGREFYPNAVSGLVQEKISHMFHIFADSPGKPTAGQHPRLPAGGGSWLTVRGRAQGQGIERTGNRGECLGRHMQIATRDAQALMPQEELQTAQIHARFQQMAGERMPTLIVTLLSIRRWPRSGTCTIPSSDKR